MAMAKRKSVETSVPIMPPMARAASMRCCSARAVAAIAADPSTTMVE
jgi:hypothetical protein